MNLGAGAQHGLLQSVPLVGALGDRDAALPRSCELAVAFASSNDGFTCSTAAPGYSAAGVDSAHKPALTSVDLLAIGSLQPTAAVSPKSPTHDRQALLSCLGSDEDAPAADEAVAAEFVELLTGKAARHRVSLITPHGLHAEHSNDGSEAQCSSPRAAAGARMQRGSLAAVSRGAPIGTTGRYSLANVGIVAAQSAGLLPGSPIPVPSLSGDAPGAATGRLLAAAGHAARHSLHQQHAVVALQTRVSSVGSKVNNNRPVSAARASTAGQEQQVSGLQRALTNHSSAGAIAALHKPLKRDDTAIKPVTSGAGHQSPRAPDCSSLQVVTERGSAAFRSTTRQQAGRVGRYPVPEADSPGPSHYHPAPEALSKHIAVPRINSVMTSSSRSASPSRTTAAAHRAASSSVTASAAQQQQQHTTVTTEATAAAQLPLSSRGRQTLEAAVAARLSVADATPRFDAEPGYSRSNGLKGCHIHGKQQVRRGTAAFKTITREQRERLGKLGRPAATANSIPTDGSETANQPATAADMDSSTAAHIQSRHAVNSFPDSSDSLTRPRSSRGPVIPFHKQTSRPASAAAAACSPALDPGYYQGNSHFPCSRTCRDLSAGHPNHGYSNVPDFGKYSSRPGTCPAAVGDGVQVQPAVGWPGVWGWSSLAEGCLHQIEESPAAASTEQQTQQHDNRPGSSTALMYARTKHSVELVAELAHAALDTRLADGTVGFLQQKQQRKRPVSVGLHKQRQAVKSAVRTRPATAGAVLGGAAGTKASSLLEAYGWHDAAQRPKTSSSRRDGVLGLQELSRYSSAGLATRVKGGSFSTASRSSAAKVLRVMGVGSVVPPASVAVLQPGTELSYEPNTEVLGHMHRSPGWSLPPNRIATSKKWAQLAQQAALQQ